MGQVVAPVVVQLPPAGDEVTLYPVIADPPSSPGGVQETVALASPEDALTPVGASGATGPRAGVTGDEAADGSEVLTVFVAVTVNV